MAAVDLLSILRNSGPQLAQPRAQYRQLPRRRSQ